MGNPYTSILQPTQQPQPTGQPPQADAASPVGSRQVTPNPPQPNEQQPSEQQPENPYKSILEKQQAPLVEVGPQQSIPSGTAPTSSANPYVSILQHGASNSPAANPYVSLLGDKESGEADTPVAPNYLNQPWYKKAWDWLWTPMLNLNPERQAGVTGAVEDIASSMTSPGNITLSVGTLGLGPVLGLAGVSVEELPVTLKAASTLVEAGFTQQQLAGFAHSSSLFLDALKEGDHEKAKYYATLAGAGLAGTALAAAHLAAKASPLGEVIRKYIPGRSPNEEYSMLGDLDNARHAYVDRALQNNVEHVQQLRAAFDHLTEGASAEDKKLLLAGMTRAIEMPQEKVKAAADIAEASDNLSPDQKAAWRRATNLSDAEQNFVRIIANEFKNNRHSMEEGGMAEHFVEHYITHVWEKPDAVLQAGLDLGNFTTRVSSMYHRAFKTILEGELRGNKLKIEDPIELVMRQRQSIAEIEANKAFQDRIMQSNISAPDGRPMFALYGAGRTIGDDGGKTLLALPSQMRNRFIDDERLAEMQDSGELQKRLDEGSIQKLWTTDKDGNRQPAYAWSGNGYKIVDHPHWRKWQWVGNTEDGKTPLLMQTDIRVHPHYADWLNDRLGLTQSEFDRNPVLKALQRVSSEAKASIFAGSPFHAITTAFTSIFTGNNPFREGPVDLNDPRIFQGVEHGLRFVTNTRGLQEFESGYNNLAEEGVSAPHGSLVYKVPLFGKYANWMHTKLWEYVNGQKSQAYLSRFKRLQAAYPDWSMDQVARKAADETNNWFGIQPFYNLGETAFRRDLTRIGLLAPDYLVSRIRAAASLLQPGSKIMAQDVARMSTFMFMATRAANYIATGDPHLEQPFGFVIPGKNKKDDIVLGPRTLLGDAIHAVQEPASFIRYRLNPATVREGMALISGRDEFGRRLTPEGQVQHFLEAVSPIPLQDIVGRSNINLDTKEGLFLWLAKSFGSVYPAKTSAEQLAQQYAYDHSESGPVDQDQIVQHVRNMQLLDGLRNGTVSMSQVNAEVQPSEARRLLRESQMTPLQAYFNKLPLSQAIYVWQLAEGQERKDISSMLWKKRIHWLESHPNLKDREKLPVWNKIVEAFPDLARH